MIVEQTQEPKPKKRSYVIYWAIGIPILLVFLIFLPPFLYAESSAIESRAKSTLRAYAETQKAYLDTQEVRKYGTWDELLESGYLAEGYAKENIIEEFTLWESTGSSKSLVDLAASETDTFTVVAFPNSPNRFRRYLYTFAIREDEYLRVYRPETPGAKAWGEDGDFGARTWEPIR